MYAKTSELSETLLLADIEALADGEDTPSHNCPGGKKESVRVNQGNEVHIFYEAE